jgi:hypothetical protein
MTDRWRRRATVAAISIACLLVATAALGATRPTERHLGVHLPDGTTLASLPLSRDSSFTLRYRNSLYGTLAEERFVVTDAGELRLVELAADQLAVLEEYYAITEPAHRAGGSRTYAAKPAHVPVIEELRIAATDHGERTLLVEGQPPLELWRLVEDDDPSVLLRLDR